MTKVQRRSPEPLRDVLYQLSLAKECPDPDLLDEYVKLYPDHAEALTDFAVQMVIDSLCPEAGESPASATQVSPTVSRAMSRFQNALHGVKARYGLSPTAGSARAPVENPFAKYQR